MAKKGGSGAYRKGRSGALGFHVSFNHPDFSKAVFKKSKIRDAENKVAEYYLTIIRPQVPIDTGQLRASYHLNLTTSVLGPRNTQRWVGRPGNTAHLTNRQLADILWAKGYLRLVITDGQRRQAVAILNREMSGRGVIEYHGRIELTETGLHSSSATAI